jgi:hypothetical protein
LLQDSLEALSPHHRFVIVMHSPGCVRETGLLVCPPEKKARKPACSIGQDTFLRSGLKARIEELR